MKDAALEAAEVSHFASASARKSNTTASSDSVTNAVLVPESGPGSKAPASTAPATATAPISLLPPSRSWLSSMRRPRTSPGPRPSAFLSSDDPRRDSALTPSVPPVSIDSASSTKTAADTLSLRKAPSLPTIVIQSSLPVKSTKTKAAGDRDSVCDDVDKKDATFSGIMTAIPTTDFDDFTKPGNIHFSKRGSLFLGGKKAVVPSTSAVSLGNIQEQEQESEPVLEQEAQPEVPPEVRPETPPAAIPRDTSLPLPRSGAFGGRALSMDEMLLSKKVRLMYEHGNESVADWTEAPSSMRGTESLRHTPSSICETANQEQDQNHMEIRRVSSITESKRASYIAKEPTEAAGGIEDWEDIEGEDVYVDRYGFIVPKRTSSRDSNSKAAAVDPPGLQRVSTALLLASESPRHKYNLKRTVSVSRSSKSAFTSGRGHRRNPSRRSSKPAASMYSYKSNRSFVFQHNPFRYAANRLPHNRDRRWMDEASDMLTLPPGLADIAEQEEGGKAALQMKRKEWQREEKWRRMAVPVPKLSPKGAGMKFEFNTKDPKLISRTWKGIPDRWRATAWHAFLSVSARASDTSRTDEELVICFHELQEEDSADDVQIDVDVPRTINKHIMFRRRYRGGQRLLFRVLHAMSLFLPETGYVQGMAALAATLLCYYDEEHTFIMLVRLWQLRGLERLYQPGFGGLMDALEEFKTKWLIKGDMASKLDDLGISCTDYGTRWYLTLFNYSIPFPAQLRVWDVFMLLGDESNATPSSTSAVTATTTTATTAADTTCCGDFDILHATSAALIDATREILLDSDFENAMKVLTSWIPVKDEDLLMKVAKAEWKNRKRAAKAD